MIKFANVETNALLEMSDEAYEEIVERFEVNNIELTDGLHTSKEVEVIRVVLSRLMDNFQYDDEVNQLIKFLDGINVLEITYE